MQSNLGIKLIAALDVRTLKLYQAKGLKITQEIGKYQIHSNVNHRPEKHESSFHRGSGPNSSFDPHTPSKDLEHHESSRAAEKLIETELSNNNNYNELIIIADPKMLGSIRKDLNSKLKKLIKVRQIETKEIKKDLMNHDIAAIEKAVFS